jgi:hypothetical protein
MKLTPYECWMVKSNMNYIKTEGIDVVVARLRNHGYNRVADAVQEAHRKNK